MMSTDKVFRTLVDAALDGQRSWPNVGVLAREADVGEKLAYKALGRPTEIGAVMKHSASGFSVTDPERLLGLLSARRSLSTARHTTLAAVQSLLPSVSAYAIGGTRAAAHHLSDTGRPSEAPPAPADHASAIVYLAEGGGIAGLPEGEGALALIADARSLHTWADGYTSKAQTYADLFAQPGWQASEFRRALWHRWFAVDDWARAEEPRG